MRAINLFILLLLTGPIAFSQLYFPPIIGNNWETIAPATLGWNESKITQLKDYLASVDSKAFIILKDGKIVIEHYMNGHAADKNWYWASAGKSLTSTLIGIAAGEGKIDLQKPSSTYLGANWSKMTTDQEQKVKVIHHISMTTGLDDKVSFECTDPECLKYLAEPGSRWSYHNAPYTLCDGIIEGATGKTLNNYFKEKIGEKTGMVGLFVKTGYNNIFYSNARTLARFGLLSLAKGKWGNTDIVKNDDYVNAMTKTSQSLNNAYGYLWWLNGKTSFMLPGSQLKYNGSLIPNAPVDMYCALGKNDQKIHVVPSLNLVVIRMGEEATDDPSPVPVKLDIKIWEYLNEIMGITSTNETIVETSPIKFDQNSNEISVDSHIDVKFITLFDQKGARVGLWRSAERVTLGYLKPGVYFVKVFTKGNEVFTKMIVII